ncbi:MAG: tyrosine-type recombinase/integrase [Lachnospiraceae bacterium]|nr:tyrosine-type recombinase/integrase [Lachnospiraceae bacterium]
MSAPVPETVTVHRHSCASLLFVHGVSLKEIQEWLGHSNISANANIYTHMDFNKKISSANAIIRLLGKEKESTSTANRKCGFSKNNAGSRT